jgi:hypothetical protein
VENVSASVLETVLDPVVECFTPSVAEEIANLRANPRLQERLDVLADKSNEGSLTEAERTEYETYVKAIDFITILQAKARVILQASPSN